MSEKLTLEELQILEDNLSCPKGEKGIEIAKKMHKSNFKMTKSSIFSLGLKKKETVLELGFGNCNHLEFLLKQSEDLEYTGLEISETMHNEALKQSAILQGSKIEFRLYNGIKIPFKKERFDKIFTVNTIYFWRNPKLLIKEIERVLKPNGTIAITFAKKKFMQNLPFVKDKFQLYKSKDLEYMINETNLFLVDFIDKKEEVESKSGEVVLREYTIAILKKKKNV